MPDHIMSDDLRERIAQRAYEFYLECGCRPGCDVEDWIDAERRRRTMACQSGNRLGHYPQRDQSTLASGATSSQADTPHVMQELLS